MKISANNFKTMMERLAPVVTTSKTEALKYIQVKCDDTTLTAVATDSIIMMQYECELKEDCNETFYLLPIKLDKTYTGDVEITNEDNLTIVKYDKTTIQIPNTINYPNVDNWLKNKCYITKVRLSKKQLIQLLKSCDEYIDLYVDNKPTKPVYVETVEAKGLICPVKNEEWN